MKADCHQVSIHCDFIAGAVRHRRLYGGGFGQAIARALGISGKFKPHVADLTAGLGVDSFVCASLGARVTLVERNPRVQQLLQAGLTEARQQGDNRLVEILSRMTLVCGDAKDWLAAQSGQAIPDVIYLDPMFPERKKSAKVKKAMQALHVIVGQDEDADELLPLALEKARYRVVVKRPAHAPWLAEREPGYSLKGKSTRFDIYPLKKMP